MNKAQEIELLNEYISKVGKDSYLFSFLEDVKHSIERDIQSDFIPQYSLNEYIQEVEKTAKQLKELEASKRKVELELNELNKFKDTVKNQIRSKLSTLQDALTNIEYTIQDAKNVCN